VEISEKERPDRWNKVHEDVSYASGRGRWKPGIKKKRGSCRAGLWGRVCMEHKAMRRVLYL
jgi:hypothetical protein